MKVSEKTGIFKGGEIHIYIYSVHKVTLEEFGEILTLEINLLGDLSNVLFSNLNGDRKVHGINRENE